MNRRSWGYQFRLSLFRIFFERWQCPFIEIAISDEKELSFKFYPSNKDIGVTLADMENILSASKEYLPKVLKNEDDFLNFTIK